MSSKDYQLRCEMVGVLQRDELPESDTIRLARSMTFCAENDVVFNHLAELDAIGNDPFIKQMLQRTEPNTEEKESGVKVSNRNAIRNECVAVVGWVEFLREMCGTDLELDNALDIVRSRVQTVLDALEKL